MKTIRLNGVLGKKFGRVHRLNVRTPGEAVRALCANFPEFEKHVLRNEKVVYRVKADRFARDAGELRHPFSKEIVITPIVRGAGTSTAKIIVGAVLIAAGVALNYFTAGGAAPFGNALIGIGVGFIVGGIAQAITPVPKLPEPPEKADNQPSYVFNGPVNTTAQGQPVPIGYGRLIVGGAVISAGISIDDISPPPPPAPPPEPPPDPNYDPQPPYSGD